VLSRDPPNDLESFLIDARRDDDVVPPITL